MATHAKHEQVQGVHELKQPIFVFLWNPFKVVNIRKMITIWKLTVYFQTRYTKILKT